MPRQKNFLTKYRVHNRQTAPHTISLFLVRFPSAEIVSIVRVSGLDTFIPSMLGKKGNSFQTFSEIDYMEWSVFPCSVSVLALWFLRF